jgi:hypothetical protein
MSRSFPSLCPSGVTTSQQVSRTTPLTAPRSPRTSYDSAAGSPASAAKQGAVSNLAALVDMLEKLGIYTGACATTGGVVGFLAGLAKWWLTLKRPDLLLWSGLGTGFGGAIGLGLWAVTA